MRKPNPELLLNVCQEFLQGVGDSTLGEWYERGRIAFHVRRRLSKDEENRVGPVRDLRGTKRGLKRYKKVWRELPDQAVVLAMQELGVNLGGG